MEATIADLRRRHGLEDCAHDVLFSLTRFQSRMVPAMRERPAAERTPSTGILACLGRFPISEHPMPKRCVVWGVAEGELIALERLLETRC